MIADGAVMLEGAGYCRQFTKGETVLIPAACEPLAWRTHTAAQLLRIQIPK